MKYFTRGYSWIVILSTAIRDVEPFIKLAILPDLVGKWFSKEPIMPLQSSSTTSSAAFSDGTSSSVSIDINQVDSIDSRIGKVNTTRSNDVHASSRPQFSVKYTSETLPPQPFDINDIDP